VRERMRRRVDELQAEFETGQTKLREQELQEARLRETLLRISGAIQVLQELLGEEDDGQSGERGTAEH
jgi:hypothetical protein